MTVKSEEDVQNKLVIPYLKDVLGLDVDDMEFQRSIKVRIGLKVYEVDSTKEPFTALGRYDALVKQGTANLFILEVKGPEIKICVDDIEQAISYARLVQPIAPIAIVTNGREWKIYDTISQEEIFKEDPRIKGPYQAQLPDEKYFEAMKYFFGLSRENVLVFSHEQVNQYMVELEGSADDREKRYIKELFEPWTELVNFFSEFVRSPKKSFAVIGDSGTGKTCWICDTAKNCLEEGHVVFFYRAVSVKDDILSMISRDLGWVLSGADVGLKSARRLLEIFKGEPIFVFLDGLDEIDLKDAKMMADDLLRMLSNYDVRLVLTCKSAEWAKLTNPHEPTRLSAELYKFNGENSYMLARLEQGQLRKMIDKHKSFYKFTGTIDEKVMADCRKNAFLMRIMFQVAQENDLDEISYGAMEFYEEYFRILYKRFPNPELIQQLLPLVAKSFYERNVAHIEYAALHQDLKLTPAEPIPADLFRLTVLEKQENTHTTYVRFYFNNLRDFLIAFRYLRLDVKSDSELDVYIRNMVPSGVRLDVLTLYYQLASEPHKRILDRDAPLNALKYVATYQDMLDKHFVNARASFDPYTSGDIGFVGYLDFGTRTIHEHGFRPVINEEEKVLLLPWNAQLDVARSAFIPGVRRLTWSSTCWGFKDINVKAEILWGQIGKSLKEIVEKGLLNEDHNQYMLEERVLATCASYLSDELGIDPRLPTDSYLPLDLAEVGLQLRFKRARQIIASARNLSERTIDVVEEAFKLAENGVFLDDRSPYQPGNYEDYIQWRLLEDIRILREMGVTRLEKGVLLNWYGKGITWEWEGKVPDGALIEKFCSIVLDQYRKIVGVNFPTFCHHFKSCREMPFTVFLLVETRAGGTRTITEVYCHDETKGCNAAIFCVAEELRIDKKAATVVYRDGKELRLFLTKTQPLFTFFSPYNQAPNFLPYEVLSGVMPVRMMVYKQLKEELEDAFRMFAVDLGAPQRYPYRFPDDDPRI